MLDPIFTLVFFGLVAAAAVGVFFLVGRRAPFLSRIVIALTAGVASWILLAMLMNMGASLTNGGAVQFYVLTPKAKAARFTADLAGIAARHGLSPSAGQTTDDEGSTAYSLGATGQGLRLWSTNTPLSGQEDAALCGHYDQAHADPGQYVLTVTPVLFQGSHTAALALLTKLSNELQASGYEIKPAPVTCSPLSKAYAH